MPELVVQVLYYANLGLAFFALIEFVAYIVLCRNTAYLRAFSAVVSAVFGVGLALALVQLVFEGLEVTGADIVVIVTWAWLTVAYFIAFVYCILLRVRSNKKLCVAAGVLQFFQPVGAIVSAVLAKRVEPDTVGQKLIYTGSAYTFAACAEYIAHNDLDFIDSTDTEKFEALSDKEIKAKLQELKNKATTPSGKFEYAATLLNYMPQKTGKAIRLFAKAANAGYAPALFNLGFCYEQGMCVRKSEKKARDLYKRAAGAGDGDAPMRLAILDVKSADKRIDKGVAVAVFKNGTNLAAKFNYGLCLERGIGTEKNIDGAIDAYCECLQGGLHAASAKLFALASSCINTAENDAMFKKLAQCTFDGAFGKVMSAMIAIKEKRASDAADIFLEAVKLRGKWEGVSRLLLGALYMDCGKTVNDRQNGAAYVKTAEALTSIAYNIRIAVDATLPARMKHLSADTEILSADKLASGAAEQCGV